MIRKFLAAVSSAAVLAGSVPAVRASAEPLPPYPLWVPSTYADALHFVNDYGAVRTENSAEWQGIVCVVMKYEPAYSLVLQDIVAQGDAELLSSSTFVFEWPDDSMLDDPKYPYAHITYEEQLRDLGLTEDMRENGGYRDDIFFMVNVYKVSPGGSAQFIAMNGETFVEYTFECDGEGNVAETDIYSWLPDCVTEYEAFRLKYPTVSAAHGYIALCTDYCGDGGYQIFSEEEGPVELFRSINYHEVGLVPMCGGNDRLIKLYEPTGEGKVHMDFTQAQEWMIGKEDPISEYPGNFEIAESDGGLQIADLDWWKDHDHNTFYKDGSENGGDFYSLTVPETFYDEPVERAVITNMRYVGGITLPDCVRDIEVRGCPQLSSFAVSGSSPYFDTYKLSTFAGSALFSKGLGELVCFPPNYNAEKISLPKETTVIGRGAFRDASGLKEVTAENVTEIGEDAFEGCTGLALYVSEESLPALKEQLGERFFSDGNMLLSISSYGRKDWNYYCALTDEQVLEEYKTYRTETGMPLAESYIKNGMIYNDIVKDTNFELAYGTIDPHFLLFTLENYTDQELTTADFGFPEEAQVEISSYSSGRCVLRITDDRYESKSAYDLMRRELTLYNSGSYQAYSKENSQISWEYLDFIPQLLPGDANGDAKVDLSDAVAILQQQALPEKYPICSSCAYMADCDGIGGISGKDALAIQLADAGLFVLEGEFPMTEPQ